MFAERVAFAQDHIASLIPVGSSVVVFNATHPDQLRGLPTANITVVQGFAPCVTHLTHAGITVVQSSGATYDAAIVLLPKSKPLARDLIAQAAACVGSGPVIVDGQKNDGIDSILKDVKKLTHLGPVISKAHGKCAWFFGPVDMSAWRAAPQTLSDGFETTAGVFSADGIDPASQLLAGYLNGSLRGAVADLGAGWGYLTRAILQNDAVTQVFAVEADHSAYMMTQRNCVDPRLTCVWADATDWRSPKLLNFVVMNPPFHHMGQADPSLGRAFIAAAARNLAPQGQLLMVANRHLPYEMTLEQCFSEVNELDGTSKFKVLSAARPRKIKR